MMIATVSNSDENHVS